MRRSTADVVKMGRPQDMGSQISGHNSAKPSQVSTPMQQEFHPDPHPQYLSNMSGAINESSISVGQHLFNDVILKEKM